LLTTIFEHINRDIGPKPLVGRKGILTVLPAIRSWETEHGDTEPGMDELGRRAGYVHTGTAVQALVRHVYDAYRAVRDAPYQRTPPTTADDQ
jgi:hypothetical protein